VLPTGAGGISAGTGLGMAPAPSLAIKMAIVVIAIIPVLLVYPFIQRHFTKGVIIGAVKG
jgi:putative aldouronate transport system permease protein